MRKQRKREQVENAIGMAFFTLLPSLFAYVAVVLFFVGAPYLQSNVRMVLLFLAGVFSYLASVVCVNILIAVPKAQEKNSSNVPFSAAKRQLSRAYDYEKRVNGATGYMLIVCYVLAVPFAAMVAAFGWLLFILYACNKFCYKVKACAKDVDLAESIIRSGEGNEEEIKYAFFRMLEHARASNLGDGKRAVRKALCRAEKLLDLWDAARQDGSQDE